MRAFISAIFFCASARFESTSFPAAGCAGDAGAGAGGAAFCLLAAILAFIAAILSCASLFFLSMSDSPLAGGGAAAGEPLLERILLLSPSDPSGSCGLFPVIIGACGDRKRRNRFTEVEDATKPEAGRHMQLMTRSQNS